MASSNVFLSTWMVALLLFMLVYVTQGSGCRCSIVGAFKATCPDPDKCDKTLVARNLNQCRRNCAGKRSNIDSLLNTGGNNGQYRGEKMNNVPSSSSNTWADATQQQNDWTIKTSSENSQCLLDDILKTLPPFWQDYILEAFEVAMSDHQ